MWIMSITVENYFRLVYKNNYEGDYENVATNYPELKYFFGKVTAKLKEPVILKKTSQIASKDQ